MKIKPIGDRILVKQLETETTTKSGIILTEKEKLNQAVVIEVGEDPIVSVGDKIVYIKYAGTVIPVDGVDHLILKNEDVIAVVD